MEGFEIEEGLLHGMEMAIFFEALDGGDRLHYFAEGTWQERRGRAADQDRAGAALAFSAAVFCAGEAEFVAQNGEEAGIGVGVDRVFLVPLISSSSGGAIGPRGALNSLRAACLPAD